MRRIVLIAVFAAVVGCEHTLTSEETCALTAVCTNLCTKYGGSDSFSFSSNDSGYGCVFNYNCLCYPKRGFGDPVSILVPKNKIDGLVRVVRARGGKCETPTPEAKP